MYRQARLAQLILAVSLIFGLAAVPAQAAQSLRPGRQTSSPSIVPFTGTATTTSISTDFGIPAKATNDLARNEQTNTFAVRDATHWRVDLHVTAPVIDSHDETIFSDGKQVVDYTTLFNRAYRLPGGMTQSPFLLSLLLHGNGAPLGITPAQYIAALKHNTKETVRSVGQAQVAGRTADVFQISPLASVSSGSCTGPKDCAKKQKGYGTATMWLDHQYGIVLRYEQHGLPKNVGGTQGYKYLVTSITFGQGPSDADLAYVPPVAIQNAPQNSGVSSGGSSGGAGPGMPFRAPPGFVSVGNPSPHGPIMTLQGVGSGEDSMSGGPSYVQGVFRGDSTQGFVFVKERIRALGLPAALTAGSVQSAGSCQAHTGTFPDGLSWLAMQRGQITILAVANKLTQTDLLQYAASGICTAPIVPPPSAEEVLDTALDHLETEIDITRQILGWVIAAAPTAADKTTLKSFDRRLESFDRTVFALRHRGDPQAKYSPPGFPPPQKGTFQDTVSSLKGEIPAAKSQLRAAEAAVQSPTDRQTLQEGGTLFDDLIRTVDGMVSS